MTSSFKILASVVRQEKEAAHTYIHINIYKWIAIIVHGYDDELLEAGLNKYENYKLNAGRMRKILTSANA